MRRTIVGLTLLLLVASISATAVALAVDGGGADGEESTSAASESRYLGLTREGAAARAAAEGRPWRVGREDHEWFALTDDYVVGRVTLELDQGLVTVASIEQPFDDSSDPSQPLTQRQRAAAEVLAAAVWQLLTVDHGLGVDTPPPFTDVHVGNALGGSAGTPLEPLQLERIAAVVNETGAPVHYVDDPDRLAAKLFNGAPPGVAVITIVALRLGATEAEVELHLWCGSLCGVYLTYAAEQVDGQWVITGIVGPIAMS